MCPRCIWPIVICCWADGMVPMLSDSVPMEPERITPGSATEPCSTRPTRLNCCWRMVDLQVHKQAVHTESVNVKTTCFSAHLQQFWVSFLQSKSVELHLFTVLKIQVKPSKRFETQAEKISSLLCIVDLAWESSFKWWNCSDECREWGFSTATFVNVRYLAFISKPIIILSATQMTSLTQFKM